MERIIPIAMLGALLLLGPATPASAAPASPAASPGPSAGADAAVTAAAVWTEHPRAVPVEPPLPPSSGPASPARKYFTDVELVDQDGRTRRLYSDLLRGKTVVAAAFFTSCATSCPLLSARLAALQEWLGERLGKDVYLLSFSVDPQTDTPARLKQYAARFGARAGWFFLTGKKENVEWALYKLGSYNGASAREAHSNLLVLGDEPSGRWKKVFGLAAPADLIHSLDTLLRGPG